MSNLNQQSSSSPAQGAYFQPTPGVALSGVATDTVNVVSIGAATTGAIYGATISARLVG
jgi:hypothetical protein